MNEARIKEIVTSHEGDAEDVRAFTLICKFLTSHPEVLSTRDKTLIWDGEAETVINHFCRQYLNAKKARVTPAVPTTVPDPAVSHILNLAYQHPQENLERIKVEHQHSMGAENAVGNLLERYIASVLEPLGWVWCAGDFIRSIDFLKLDGEHWTELQIKNRSNSENSSSSSVRNNTTIDKWYRTSSSTGKTRWEKFPESQAIGLLTEQGFMDFITSHFNS